MINVRDILNLNRLNEHPIVINRNGDQQRLNERLTKKFILNEYAFGK
jgi:hypothetical protein